jgi:hypothetical protein
VNSEFEKLAPEEIRMLREYRAKKAITERPVSGGTAVHRQWRIIREAAMTILQLSPGNVLAGEVLELVPDSVCS